MVTIGTGNLQQLWALRLMNFRELTNKLKTVTRQAYTACYCERCRRPLAESRLVDSSSAYCPECQVVENTTGFQTKPWMVGVAALVAANFSLAV